MTILFFDTETTGLPDTRSPVTATHQPHVVQLAAILTDDDGTERACVNLIVNPGVPIPKGASDVHGITDDVAEEFGIEPKHALRILARLMLTADTIVAHNIEFDLFLLETMWFRSNISPKSLDEIIGGRRMVAAGFDKPKPPKLEEAYRHFFGEDLDGAHDALVDVRACRRVYFAVRALAGETA